MPLVHRAILFCLVLITTGCRHAEVTPEQALAERIVSGMVAGLSPPEAPASPVLESEALEMLLLVRGAASDLGLCNLPPAADMSVDATMPNPSSCASSARLVPRISFRVNSGAQRALFIPLEAFREAGDRQSRLKLVAHLFAQQLPQVSGRTAPHEPRSVAGSVVSAREIAERILDRISTASRFEATRHRDGYPDRRVPSAGHMRVLVGSNRDDTKLQKEK